MIVGLFLRLFPLLLVLFFLLHRLNGCWIAYRLFGASSLSVLSLTLLPASRPAQLLAGQEVVPVGVEALDLGEGEHYTNSLLHRLLFAGLGGHLDFQFELIKVAVGVVFTLSQYFLHIIAHRFPIANAQFPQSNSNPVLDKFVPEDLQVQLAQSAHEQLPRLRLLLDLQRVVLEQVPSHCLPHLPFLSFCLQL